MSYVVEEYIDAIENILIVHLHILESVSTTAFPDLPHSSEYNYLHGSSHDRFYLNIVEPCSDQLLNCMNMIGFAENLGKVFPYFASHLGSDKKMLETFNATVAATRALRKQGSPTPLYRTCLG